MFSGIQREKEILAETSPQNLTSLANASITDNISCGPRASNQREGRCKVSERCNGGLLPSTFLFSLFRSRVLFSRIVLCLDRKQFYFKDQRGIRPDIIACTLLSVCQDGRDKELPF